MKELMTALIEAKVSPEKAEKALTSIENAISSRFEVAKMESYLQFPLRGRDRIDLSGNKLSFYPKKKTMNCRKILLSTGVSIQFLTTPGPLQRRGVFR